MDDEARVGPARPSRRLSAIRRRRGRAASGRTGSRAAGDEQVGVALPSNTTSGSSERCGAHGADRGAPLALWAAKIAVGGSADSSISEILAGTAVGAVEQQERRILGDVRLGEREPVAGYPLLHRPQPRVVRERGDAATRR